MVEHARRVWMRFPAAGAAVMLAAGALAGCGGSGSAGSDSGGASSHTSPIAASTSASTTSAPDAGSLILSPADPTTSSEITFAFTARAASGVHGSREISYSLSLMGPDHAGCVGAHETGSPPVARGAQARITLGPKELQSPWCAGRYSARVLELSSAHCTGSSPCPQYVRVVGLIGSVTFTIRRA